MRRESGVEERMAWRLRVEEVSVWGVTVECQLADGEEGAEDGQRFWVR